MPPLTLGLGSNVVIHRLNGAPCATDDWMPFDQAVPAGQKVEFSATNGRSSNVSPWFNIDWGTGGVITAIGWSGQWTASVELRDGNLRTQAGMQNLHTILHPGESIRSPRIMQLYWQGGDQYRAYNLFRRTMLAHIVPRIDGKVVEPPIVHLSTSFYELNDSNEQNVLSHLDSLKGLGFEMFWLDAYWTGPNGFPNSMGNYGFPIERVEPKDRFPHGLKAIGDAVEKAGLKFLMWFEPERVAGGTYIAKEHPEWVIGGTGGGLYNLGIPEARKFMTDYLNAAIKEYKLTCLRIDYNIDPLGAWQSMDAKDPNRVGMTEMRYVEGLYQMWDDILKANPKLFIDDCASGGRRVDLEAVSRCARALEKRQYVRHARSQSEHRRVRGTQEPVDERGTEPLPPVQHGRADGRDALSVPKRLQRRDSLWRGHPRQGLPARPPEARHCRRQEDSEVLLRQLLPALGGQRESARLVYHAVSST